MKALWIVLAAMALYMGAGYFGWSRYIAWRVFGMTPENDDLPTPAHMPDYADGMDYVPTNRFMLWGHHFTSVAGAAPIIGPAVAVFWGWLPALLWIVFGTIFIGAVHDFGTLAISARNGGQGIAELSGDLISPRVRLLFQLIIYFLIWIVLAVFGFAIGVLFDTYPASVIPINAQILAAMAIGWAITVKKIPPLMPTLIVLIILYLLIPVGIQFPISISQMVGETGPGLHLTTYTVWALFLLVYSGIASVLPVWLMLQPRDAINAYQLVIGMALLILGLAVLNPTMAAPALNPNPAGAPPMIPLLFVTVACGAVSGFHGLVASGTTSKQLNHFSDARMIGYGSMLGEGLLAVLATVAVCAGLPDWGGHYHAWNTSGIQAIARFVQGAANFMHALGIPTDFSTTLVALMVIAFAATSMDTAARIQRLIVMSWAETFRLPVLKQL
ncbi:MAG: carbon starvation protein A [Cyanobacteria bacterium HKST-UBA03]|nr:carbon starvation protein A [Cyanobacteria bacterium HKST-UBA03]